MLTVAQIAEFVRHDYATKERFAAEYLADLRAHLELTQE